MLGQSGRSAALAFKVIALVAGLVVTVYATGYLYDEVSYIAQQGVASLGEVVVALAAMCLALTGVALVASLPDSMRIRFRRPQRIKRDRPVYGFGTVLAVGVGATLGSPLFILIPQNIVQYEFVSVGSLFLAMVLSVLMAKVYADMYTDSRKRGLEAVGGPSFTKVAVGVRSVRYFVSRVSMWVANTALAAYSKIIFLVFDFTYFPSMLARFGLSSGEQTVVVWVTALSLIGWTVLDSFYEERLLSVTGAIQIVLTSVMVVILVMDSVLLGDKGSWNLAGILHYTGGGYWPAALVINTGYLYLLFFGFQEIQSLERDSLERTPVPVVSWIKRGYTMGKAHYLGVTMVLTVVITGAINILYAVAVYSFHSAASAISSAEIPAFYLAQTYLGSFQNLLMGICFLIASVTTFVPAFLAATRHLRALGEDGYMPSSLANLSWLFTLVSIFLLAVSNENFLVDITDFMVLVSLGVICLSGVWLRRTRGMKYSAADVLPIAVGATCFIAGGAVYLISSSVVVFGTLAILFAYLAFDILELGNLGVQLFLAVLSLACLPLLRLFPHAIHAKGTFLSLLPITATNANDLLLGMLIVAPLFLLVNAYVDSVVAGLAKRRR